MSEHRMVIIEKTGEETGRRLKQATCSCGWMAPVWYGQPEYVTESFERHLRAIAEGSAVVWMIAPAGSVA